MQVRSKFVPLREMSRLTDNSALEYFKDAEPWIKRIGDEDFVIPMGQIFVLIGGRSSLAAAYGILGPRNLYLQWSNVDEAVSPNLQVIRHKQIIGHNYTLLAFGAIVKPVDKNNRKNPVYDLQRELTYDTSRNTLAKFLTKVLQKA